MGLQFIHCRQLLQLTSQWVACRSLQLHYNIPRVSDAENVCSQYQLRISGQACLLCKYTIGLGIMHRYGAFQVLVWWPW